MRGGSIRAGARRAAGVVAALLLLTLAAGAAPQAGATSPGANGKIAFQQGWGSSTNIWTVHVDGSGAKKLGAGQNPSWSPNGRRVAFALRDNAGIATRKADGTGLDVVTQNGGNNPSWSPNGSKIVFDKNGKLVIMNSTGGGATVLRNGTDPAWSPNSNWIAFVHNWDVWLVRADGTGARALTTYPTNPDAPVFDSAGRPDWAPSGNRVLFNHVISTCFHEFVTVRPDGGGMTDTSSGASCALGDAAYSPSGTRFVHAVQVYENSPMGPTGGGIYVMRTDGAAETAVIERDDVYFPSWQPRP